MLKVMDWDKINISSLKLNAVSSKYLDFHLFSRFLPIKSDTICSDTPRITAISPLFRFNYFLIYRQ